MQRILLLLAAVVMTACAPTDPRIASYAPKNAPAPSAADRALAADLTREINVLRAAGKREPVAADEKLSAVARIHSRDMAAGLAPLGVGGFEQRRAAAGLLHTQEMVAARRDGGAGSARTFVEGWNADTGRRRALMQTSSRVGVGVAHAKDGRAYVTLILTAAGWQGDPLDSLGSVARTTH